MVPGTRTAHEGEPAGGASKGLPWAAVLWFGAFLIACYVPVLARLARQWAADEDMGHGFFVPLVAGYIAWQRRDELAAIIPSPNPWGLAVLAWGAAQLYFATLGAELFLARTAFIISLAGLILFTAGTRTLKILSFPLFLLFFMVPIPAIIYTQITFKFQLLASRLAENALAFLGVPVLREGNILDLATQRLSVVEACSGIRSLLTLSFLSLVYAYFFDKKVWMRFALLVSTVPIAIIANASRVTITGLLSEVNPQLAEGVFHTASGWVIFMVALVILIATHWVINRVYKGLIGCRKRGQTYLPASPELPSPLAARDGADRSDPFFGSPSVAQTSFGFLKSRTVQIATALLVAQAIGLYAVSRREEAPLSRPLANFPLQLGSWGMAQEGVVEKEVMDVLKADDVLTRTYADTARRRMANLFVAYFKSQRTGQMPHSPKNCLPGSGWTPSESDLVTVDVPGLGRPIRINRYVVAKGEDKSVVLYWYQSRERVIASEYRARLYMIEDAIRYNRTDTALVRVVVPVAGNEVEAATKTAEEFVRAFFMPLKQYLPS